MTNHLENLNCCQISSIYYTIILYISTIYILFYKNDENVNFPPQPSGFYLFKNNLDRKLRNIQKFQNIQNIQNF